MADGESGESEAAWRGDLPPGCSNGSRRPGAGREPPLEAAAGGSLCRAVPAERGLKEKVPAGPLQALLQDLLCRLQDWLLAAEETARAACPAAAHPSYAESQKELQRFEALRGQVSARLWRLEALNRRYQQLTRSGSGASTGLRLRAAVRGVNQRWDALQARAAAVARRLKHFMTQWEEFESEREALWLWLAELNLRLMDVEHFSEGTSLEKMIQLQAFQEDVQANAERLDRLLVRGEGLIQKCQPEDAELLEEELQDLSCFCQEVFCGVFRFRRQLVSLSLVFEGELLSDCESGPESSCLTEEPPVFFGPGEAGAPWPPLATLSPPTPEEDILSHTHQGLKVGGALDLEWDPSVDVGGSASHDEEDPSSCRALTGVVDPWEEPCQKGTSSPRGSYSVTRRHGSQEGLSAPRGFRGQWEQLAGLARDPNRRTGTSEFPAGLPSVARKTRPWGVGACQEPPRLLGKEGGCSPGAPVGFDPQRPETWLDKSCQEMEGRQLVREECCRLPEVEVYDPVKSQRSSRPDTRGKPKWLAKRRAKGPPIARPGLGSNRQIAKRKPPHSQPAEPATIMEKGAPPKVLRMSTPWRMLPLTLTVMLLVASLLLLLLLLLRTASPPSLAHSVPSCFQTNGYARSFHLMLRHRGPPPT